MVVVVAEEQRDAAAFRPLLAEVPSALNQAQGGRAKGGGGGDLGSEVFS